MFVGRMTQPGSGPGHGLSHQSEVLDSPQGWVGCTDQEPAAPSEGDPGEESRDQDPPAALLSSSQARTVVGAELETGPTRQRVSCR